MTPLDMYETLYDQVERYPVLDVDTRVKYLKILDELKETIEEFNKVSDSDIKLDKVINNRTKLFDRI
ncbi:hypothetical protein F6Y05_39540 [Bacillus megaterium]|nr:hypothetical protein [Priestia megaterium]